MAALLGPFQYVAALAICAALMETHNMEKPYS
jgi:hypothetical protein